MEESAPHREDVSARRQLLRGCLVLLAVVISVPVVAIYIMARPAMPRHLLRQIAPGMTKAEVRHVLGEPQDREGDYQWEYWRWGNAGWVEVFFNEDGTVNYVNDESAFP